ncbi:hypothetical protein N7495_003076 [Penicillium taxi]|uniref:uncharacterized protein n=1 Tax=Penicillium taxi TaxID=168475 RepID=UPI00254520E3|nr:uncharacterized protein N7495_003076 [Penicillium taxi]KAJ5902548.1 hypothetical protein N7495_003076 [Penicillium taxi]
MATVTVARTSRTPKFPSHPPLLQPPQQTPAVDPNMANPQLQINREAIYEQKLPGEAYITAHVQRLQHGFYQSSEVSDPVRPHVDFLAIDFIFHSPNTQTHRFKAATIRAKIENNFQVSDVSNGTSDHPNMSSGDPYFLMHAPHLIYGTVSPETMQWTFSLAGSLGISDTPVSASLVPSGTLKGKYRRFEMMRIQGSARKTKSPIGRMYDVEAGEVVWSIEENTLQQSGLPREFTFVMLVQKPTADACISLTIEIDPVLQTWLGSFPKWVLSLPSYKPLKCRSVDFRKQIGQRFGSSYDARLGRRYNFASLVQALDNYVTITGQAVTRKLELPEAVPEPEINPRTYRPYNSTSDMIIMIASLRRHLILDLEATSITAHYGAESDVTTVDEVRTRARRSPVMMMPNTALPIDGDFFQD